MITLHPLHLASSLPSSFASQYPPPSVSTSDAISFLLYSLVAQGKASFVDAHTVAVEEEGGTKHYTAKTILIAVGIIICLVATCMQHRVLYACPTAQAAALLAPGAVDCSRGKRRRLETEHAVSCLADETALGLRKHQHKPLTPSCKLARAQAYRSLCGRAEGCVHDASRTGVRVGGDRQGGMRGRHRLEDMEACID